MDDAGPIHGHTGDDAAFHQVDDNGIESNFDYMGTHAENNRMFSLIGLYNGGYDTFELPACQDIGQFGQKFPVGGSLVPGSGKIVGSDLAFAIRKTVGLYLA